jgi:hypothetical protein
MTTSHVRMRCCRTRGSQWLQRQARALLRPVASWLKLELKMPSSSLAAVLAVLDWIVDEPDGRRSRFTELTPQSPDEITQHDSSSTLSRHQPQRNVARAVAAIGASDPDPVFDELGDGGHEQFVSRSGCSAVLHAQHRN